MLKEANVKDLFELCTPRKDVLKGGVKESDFAADLAQVLNGEAPREYQDPALFFANTHPTRGLRALLKNVCLRLTTRGGEAASVFRLDTQYGGGKTHALIALSHTAGGMKKVANVEEFLDPELVPTGKVRLAAFDGENADPVNGRSMGHGLRAYTPWGELAYALAGVEGYEAVRASDQERRAPGAGNIRALFGGEPTLILLDELSVYLRKVKGRSESEQLTPFLTALFKAVESSPGAALVFTLAIGKGGLGLDAYSAENEFVARQMDEAESVAARKATVLDPTSEQETAQVLRRRLFSSIDDAGAAEVVAAYRGLWSAHTGDLPAERPDEDREAELRAGYPLHPALMSTLTDKLSTLANFQRVRGMLRLMARAVGHLWKEKPRGTHAIHLHHLDPGHDQVRNEVVTRLELASFDPAMRNDVSAPPKSGHSLAQQLDAKHYAGLAPYASFVARTILWHTFAFNEELKGATPEELRYAVLAPDLEVGFINDARQKFVKDSAYLDDRPRAALRFLTEANLNQIIRRAEARVDPGEARAQLQDRIRTTFGSGGLNLVPFAAGPYDVPDEVGDGRPHLVLISHDAVTVSGEALQVPDLVAQIFGHEGSQGAFRKHQNNLVFLLADGAQRDEIKARVVRRLALEALKLPERLGELAEHQQLKVEELYERSEQELAVAIQQCYRHLFYPSRNRVEGAGVDLGHTAFDVPSASEKPGAGQKQVLRALKDMRKLHFAEDAPLAPAFVRDQTPLKKGQISTAALRAEFRKDPRLPILLGDDNFVAMVRKGIEEGVYVYRSGDLLAGQGDPWCDIKIDQQSLVFTAAYAKEKSIWPRPAPKPEPPAPGPSSGAPGGGGRAGEPPVTYDPGGKPAPAPLPPGVQVFKAEDLLRAALTQIWEQSQAEGCARIRSLSLRVFEADDAFRLLGAVGSIPGADKQLTMSGAYETAAGSTFEVSFEGIPKDAEPLKEFLVPQFRAARAGGNETELTTEYKVQFEEGLDLAGDAAAKLTDKLDRFAKGAVFVEAEAEGEK